MGQQVFAIAGQVVGGYFFGPIGAAIGGAIGGVIGGALFNEDQRIEGPRLSDLKIQTSVHGNAVPLIYGTVRVAGNLIWSSDIREIANQTDDGGKGGPTITQIDFTYEVDCAIAIGEGELLGIERIYSNGVLVYDVAFGSSPANIFASGQWIRGIVFYNGSETQLPDPTIEAAHGAGNVSGYRGTSYVMLQGIQLNTLGVGSIPNFEFVVHQDGDVDQYIRKIVVQDVWVGSTQARVTMDGNIIRHGTDTALTVDLYDMSGNFIGTDSLNDFEAGRPPMVGGGDLWGAWLFESDTDPEGALVRFYGLDLGGPPRPRDVLIGNTVSVEPFLGTGREMVSATICADNRSIIVLDRETGGLYADRWVRFEWDGSDLSITGQGTIDPVIQYEYGLGAPSSGEYFDFSFAESDGRTIWAGFAASNFQVDLLQIDNNGVLRKLYQFNSINGDGLDPGSGGFYNSIYADSGVAVAVTGSGPGPTNSALIIFTRVLEIDGTGVPVADIISDLCDRSTIPQIEYDVTDINSTCDGFVIGQTMTGRAAIDVLRPAYFFDAVDGETLKFVERGGAVADTFEYDDLGAGHNQPREPRVATRRQQERELPARVNIKYLASSADYQVSSQSARRETTPSQEILELPLAIVMTDDYAAQVADVVLRDAWISSSRRMFSTAVDYAELEPTDVVEVDDGNVVRTCRIAKRIDSGHLIEWEAIDEDVAVYDSNATGVALQVPSQALQVQGPTRMEVLDLPPLTELASGNEAAAYVAVRGFLSTWTAAKIDISRNGGTTYESGTTISTASVIGVATTALANFLGGNVWDEASTVRVDVSSSTLASATHDEVLDGANGIVIGDEVLQYRTATLVSAGVYDLTGFLRGRKGTEWAISMHAVGDRFVRLTTNLGNLPLQIADRVNASIKVRATSSGMAVANGTVKAFAPQIARLMPYSPVHLSAVRNESGGWYLSWVRRDRYMNDWNSGVDVPLSETAELYDVEVYNVGGELVQNYSDINDPFLDIDPSVLGGSPTPTSITYSAWQKSSIVGRGFEASATITQAL